MDESKDGIKIIESSLKSYNLEDGKILIPMYKIAYLKLGSSKENEIDEKFDFEKLSGNFCFCSLTPISYIVSENEKIKEYKVNENEDVYKWIEFLKIAINLLKKKENF